ncbi:MAG: hydrogenase maturation nickel metallochaperone HypA [Clostridiaceae bacterium]
MHELGVIIEVVKRVEKIAIQNHLTKIDTLVIEIGELSTIIPAYIKSCYPAAVDGTILEETKLKIEILKGFAKCSNCLAEYRLIENEACCPECKSHEWILLSGKEFMIKEIMAY